jgi:hypothetical protein
MSPRNREHKRGKRQGPSLLDEVLERRVLMYMVAAGATLAGASAVQAKVVFTPSNAVLSYGGVSSLPIDLDNNGTVDFRLLVRLFSYGGGFNAVSSLNVKGAIGSNVVVGANGYRSGYAAALTRGAPIGSSAAFRGALRMVRVDFSSCGGYFVAGSFADVTNRFLGVRFLINGEAHYGWIGFRSVTFPSITATLVGWAYETVSNRHIRAGDRMGMHSDSAALRSTGPTSLELLAAGNVAMTDWRRRRAG